MRPEPRRPPPCHPCDGIGLRPTRTLHEVPGAQRFRARLEDAGGGGAAFDVPADAVAALGTRKRPPVRVTIGDYTFRTTVAVYGGQPMIGVNKRHRAAAAVEVGDRFDVVMALDEERAEGR
jgi:hypothetical protein